MNARPDPSWGDEVFRNAKFAEGFEPQAMRHALWETHVRVSTLRQDQREATDFVQDARYYRWGSRMRRLSSTRGREDVTIRTRSARGGKTEVSKLHLVDKYLYAWIDGCQLHEFIAFDVKKFLSAGLLERRREIFNGDGTAFVAIPSVELQEVGAIDCGIKYPDRPMPLHWNTNWRERRLF